VKRIVLSNKKNHCLQKIKMKQEFLGFLAFFQEHEKLEINKE